MSDEQVASLAASGDRRAMEELAARFHPLLYRYFMKLARHPEDAGDLTQMALIRMIDKIHLYRGGPKFAAWLFKLAYHVFIDEVRKRKPTPLDMEALERTPDARDDYAAVEAKNHADRLLEALSEELRSMVVLRYYLDLDYEHIGKAMGCSAKRVKWRLNDAMTKLRKENARWIEK